MIRLSISEQGQQPRLVTFNKASIVLGRLDSCDLCLQGKGVSSQHCRISQVPGGFRIEDMGSTNGTYVNRVRVAAAQSVTGFDEIVMAVYQIRILDDVGARPATGSMPVAGAAPTATPAFGTRPVTGSMPVAAGGSGGQPMMPPPGASTGPSPVFGSGAQPMSQPPGVHGSGGHTPLPGPVRSGVTTGMPPPSPMTAGPGGAFDDARWVREWERIDKLVQQWIAARRDRTMLLRGDKLAHARRWLEQGRGRKPPPKREHKEFIRASARAGQTRIVRNVAIGGLVLGIGGTAAWKLIQMRDDPEPVDGDTATATGGETPTPEVVPPPRDDTAIADALAAKALSLAPEEADAAAIVALEGLEALPTVGLEDVRGSAAERALRQVTAKVQGRPLLGHSGAIAAVAMSNDGRWVASVDVGSDSSAVSLWDLERPGAARATRLRGHLGAVRHLAFADDGKTLVTAGEDEDVWRWNLAESPPHGQPFAAPESGITAMSISGDGRWLVVGGRSGRARAIDLSTPASGSTVLDGHTGAITSVFLSRDGTRVATASDDGFAIVRRLAAGKLVGKTTRLEGHLGAVLSVAISPDGKWALTGGADARGRLWDLTARVPSATVRELSGHDEAVSFVGFTPDGRFALTAGADDLATVFKMTVAKPEEAGLSDRRGRGQGDITAMVLRGPKPSDPVAGRMPYQVVFGSADGSLRTLDPSQIDKTIDGNVIAAHAAGKVMVGVDGSGVFGVSGGADARVKVWDLAQRHVEGVSLVGRGHRGQVLDVAMAPAATRVLSGGADGTARLWDATAPTRLRPLVELPEHKGRVRVAVTPDGRFGATASEDGIVHLWGLESEDPRNAHAAYAGHTAPVNALEFGPDGKVLVSVASDKTVRVWRMTDDPGKDVVVLQHDDIVRLVAIGPTSRWLLTAGVKQMNLWDLNRADPTGATRRLRGHDSDILSVAISADGHWAASGDANDRVVLWNLLADEPKPLRLKKHEDGVDVLAFSPDGSWLASGGRDRKLVLWRTSSKHPEDDPVVLPGHAASLSAVAWSADGRWLYSGDGGGVVRAWPVAAGKDIAEGVMVLDGHASVVARIRVATDGSALVTGSWDGAVRLWPLQPDGLHRVGCMMIGRSLTGDEWESLMNGSPRDTCE